MKTGSSFGGKVKGMNAALEDCLLLDQALKASEDNTEEAFAHFQKLRKIDTDTLSDISKNHFYELNRNKSSFLHRFKSRFDLKFHEYYPKFWIPLYSLISHTSIRYSEAKKRVKTQELILLTTSVLILVTICLTLIEFRG